MAFFKKTLFKGILLLLALASNGFAQNADFEIYPIPDQTIHVGDDYSYSVYLTSYEPIEYIRKSRGADWLKVDDTVDKVYGTPSSIGTYGFNIIATGKDPIIQYDTESFTITVIENPAPSFTSSPDKTGKEKELYRYDISVSDNNQSDMELTVVSKPSFLSFVDIDYGKGRLQGTPGYNDAGTYTVKIRASDNNPEDPRSTTQTYTLAVENTNRSPSIESKAPTSGEEGTKYSYAVEAVDPDREFLFYRKTSGPKWLSFSESTLQGTPGYSDAGRYTVEIKVSDGNDDSDSDTESFELTVLDVNRSPKIEPIGKQSVKESSQFSYSVSTSDPDGNNISYEKVDGPGWLSFSGSTLVGTPGYSDAGSYTIKIQVSDGNGGSDRESFTLSVSNKNRSPGIEPIGKQSIKENEQFSYSVSASDPDGDDISYSKASGPNWLSFSGNTLQGTPGDSDAGSYTVKVRVTDVHDDSSTESFELTVKNVNRSPGIQPIDRQSAKENEEFSYAVSASDPDGDDLFYSKIAGPKWLSFSGHTLQGTPGYSDAGSYTVKVRVKDVYDASHTESFELSVSNINQAPKITSTPPAKAIEGSTYKYVIEATDGDEDPITYSYMEGPSWLSLSENTLTGKPGYSLSGKFTITVKVSDGKDSNTQSYTLAVGDSDREPTFTSTPITDAKEQETYSNPITVFDAVETT